VQVPRVFSNNPLVSTQQVVQKLGWHELLFGGLGSAALAMVLSRVLQIALWALLRASLAQPPRPLGFLHFAVRTIAAIAVYPIHRVRYRELQALVGLSSLIKPQTVSTDDASITPTTTTPTTTTTPDNSTTPPTSTAASSKKDNSAASSSTTNLPPIFGVSYLLTEALYSERQLNLLAVHPVDSLAPVWLLDETWTPDTDGEQQ